MIEITSCYDRPNLISVKGIKYMTISREQNDNKKFELIIYHEDDDTCIGVEFNFYLEAYEAYKKIKDAISQDCL